VTPFWEWVDERPWAAFLAVYVTMVVLALWLFHRARRIGEDERTNVERSIESLLKRRRE
jgi:hypothetical protein